MRQRKPDFSSYKPGPRESIRRDAANFLVWARDKHPGVFISYGEICQRIGGHKKKPGTKNYEVIALRAAASPIRKLLMAEHGCGLKVDSTLGMRATTDDADLLKTQMVGAAARLRSSQRMFTATSDLIDIDRVASTAENKPYADWYKKSVLPVVKSIATTDFTAKLLPPKREEPPSTK